MHLIPISPTTARRPNRIQVGNGNLDWTAGWTTAARN
jgi:hypothetical protein